MGMEEARASMKLAAAAAASPIEASFGKATVGRQLVTFGRQPERATGNRRQGDRSTVPKSSLESISSRCSLWSLNDERQDSSRTDSSQLAAGGEPRSKPSYLLEPSDELSWRPRSFNFEGGGEKQPMAAATKPDCCANSAISANSTLSQSLKAQMEKRPCEEGGGGGGGEEPAVQPPFMFAGIVASILSSVFFSLAFLCVKLLPDNSFIANARTLAFRGLIISTCSGLASIRHNASLAVRRDELWIIFLRCLLGTMAIYGAYCSLKFISMGDSTALVFSSPIWTSLLGRLILKEPIQCSQLVALPASILGIVLIAHPALIVEVDQLAIAPAHHLMRANSSEPLIEGELAEYQHRWPGIVIALCTSLCVSGSYIVLKFRKSTPIQTTTFWLGMAMASASLLVLAAAGHTELPGEPHEWGLLVVNGVFSWLGQSILQWALSYESASILSVVRTIDVALTFALSALFLDEEIYWTSIVGATIIGLVVASIMLNNYLAGCSLGSPLGRRSARAAAKSYQLDEKAEIKVVAKS